MWYWLNLLCHWGENLVIVGVKEGENQDYAGLWGDRGWVFPVEVGCRPR